MGTKRVMRNSSGLRPTSPVLTVRAGARARAHLQREGLHARDVAIVPAAAGGPKGLILNALDQWLFGQWLPSAPRKRDFIGASIGAWRMAAAVTADPHAAFARLAHHYTEQRYGKKPSPREVSEVGYGLMAKIFGGHLGAMVNHPLHRLHLIAVHGRGALAAPASRGAEMRGFGAATVANTFSRRRLARHLNRVIFSSMMPEEAYLDWLFGHALDGARAKFDAFDTHCVPLSERNLVDALIASGTIPLILEAVKRIDGAPTGTYWDGGIIDYHAHLPYARAPGLTLYPHFVDYIIPGWLDKAMPWRKLGLGQGRQGDPWLDNVVLIAPSREFVATLPNRKLPDRGDFKRYGSNHEGRIAAWNQAIGESGRLAEAFQQFVIDPTRYEILPL